MGWVITMQLWAQISYLHSGDQFSARTIAHRLGLSRDTVARAVNSSEPVDVFAGVRTVSIPDDYWR